MSEGFKLPARPWGEAEIKLLHANVGQLDNETLVELGIKKAPKAKAPTAKEIAEAEVAKQKEIDDKAEVVAKEAAKQKEADEKAAAEAKAAEAAKTSA